MKRYFWIFLILIVLIIGTVFIFNKNNNSNQDTYTAERTDTEINYKETNKIDTEDEKENEKEIKKENKEVQRNKKEEKIAEFSTRLPKETKARDNNINLACKTLNGTVIKQGETFSLWENLGCPTKEKGYEKAKTFTSEGEITKSYGGGICQISTTIYNAVLKVDGLKITERHEHSREVPYIKDGKDAAVSYNTSDLKFKNNLEYDVKIEAKLEDEKVKIKLIRI